MNYGNSGSYAAVYKGKSKRTGQVVALKQIALKEDEGVPFTAIREASLLKILQHSNIVTLHDIIHTDKYLTLVFEYMKIDLAAYIEEQGSCGIQPREALLFCFQLMRGLHYCHKQRVLHRDIKPQNLLIGRYGQLKLADFGLARAKSIPSNTFSNEVVTLWYRPPDVLLGSRDYTTSLDIWGAGCIFVEMMSGTPAFPGQNNASDQLLSIFKVLGTPTLESWPELEYLPYYAPDRPYFNVNYHAHPLTNHVKKLHEIEFGVEFALSLLCYQPEKRLTAMEAMHHEVFKKFPKEVHRLSDLTPVTTLHSMRLKNF